MNGFSLGFNCIIICAIPLCPVHTEPALKRLRSKVFPIIFGSLIPSSILIPRSKMPVDLAKLEEHLSKRSYVEG